LKALDEVVKDKQPHIPRTIMKSRIIRPVAAAVVVTVAFVAVTHRLSRDGHEIEIPQQLAQLPIVQLVDMYLGRSAVGGQADYDKDVLEVALRARFDKFSPGDIAIPGTGERTGVCEELADSHFGDLRWRGERGAQQIPVSKIVEASDIVVQARVNEVTLDSRDLVGVVAREYVSYAADQAEAEGIDVDNDFRDALWLRCVDALDERFGPLDRFAEYFGDRVRADAELQIIDAYPSDGLAIGGKLHIRPVFSRGGLDLLEQGREYLIGLKHREGISWLLQENIGIYPIDVDTDTVKGFIRCDLTSAEDAGDNTLRMRSRSEPAPPEAADKRVVPIALDEAWVFVMAIYDAVHRVKDPPGDVLDYWLAKLQSEDFFDCWMAVEYLGTLASPPVAPQTVIDAIELHLGAVDVAEPDEDLGRLLNSIYQRTSFFEEALEVLLLAADEPAVNRMLTLYQEALASSEPVFHEVRETDDDVMVNILRLAVKHPGPDRRGRLVSLLSSFWILDDRAVEHELQIIAPQVLGTAEGEDIDSLVMEMVAEPASFSIPNPACFRAVWTTAAQRALPEFGEYLEQVLADPSALALRFEDHKLSEEGTVELAQYAKHIFIWAAQARRLITREQAVEMLIDEYRQGNESIRDGHALWNKIMDSIVQLIDTADPDVISFLAETVANEEIVPILITAKGIHDPRFADGIKQALEKNVTGEPLGALFVCGGQEEAIQMALSEIDKPVNDDPDLTDPVRIGYKFEDRASIIEFLGTTGDERAVPVVESFTQQDVIEQFREESVYGAAQLQRSAVVALARLGGPSAIPRLRQLYASGDIHIQILAALGLYSLGDDTGYELIEHFVNHTERSVPEIELEWDQWKGCAEIYEWVLKYLASDRTKALLLERLRDLRHGYTTDWALGDYGYGYEFLKEHRQHILPIIVEQLASTDRDTRDHADRLLRELTGRDFGFRDDRFAGQQDDIIERWRTYIDDYLAESGD
jgi:hypothetical protein